MAVQTAHTKSIRNRVQKMRKEGRTIKDIAKAVNLSTGGVQYYVYGDKKKKRRMRVGANSAAGPVASAADPATPTVHGIQLILESHGFKNKEKIMLIRNLLTER